MDGPFNPMGAPFNPSTSCQGANHVFVDFLLHHPVDGWAWRGVRGVYGAVERQHAAPAVVGRLGLVLDKNSGFAEQGGRRTADDGRAKPGSPQAPFLSFNRKPQRNSDLDFRFFAVSISMLTMLTNQPAHTHERKKPMDIYVRIANLFDRRKVRTAVCGHRGYL